MYLLMLMCEMFGLQYKGDFEGIQEILMDLLMDFKINKQHT